MRDIATLDTNRPAESLRDQVRSAVIWRSGTQIAGQLIAWGSTFLVIRILSPSDYGLFAMTQVILVLLNMLNGYGLASALIQKAEDNPVALRRAARQLFGMLILLNGALALAQIALAPLAAAYFRHPEVAVLLQVQALLYLATPFIALPYALLARAMDFRRQALVNVVASVAGALTALGGALAGWGVWTLVAAPMALFAVRAIGMMIAANAWMWPSFDFTGAGAMARYGGLMAASQFFWFIQSQADVFIAGRSLDAHQLGVYTTALFLAHLFVAKFVPPLNEIAFSAYARIQHDRASVAQAFLTGARIVFVAAMPFYLGLAVVAGPMVEALLGAKWAEAAPLVALIALAMPFLTLQTLFAPATDACGRPEIGTRNGATGAIVLPAAFLIGIGWGTTGLALAWVAACPVFLLLCARRSLPAIGVTSRALAEAIAVPLLAALAMAALLLIVDRALPPLAAWPRLILLTTLGAAIYGGWLWLFARDAVREIARLVRR